MGIREASRILEGLRDKHVNLMLFPVSALFPPVLEEYELARTSVTFRGRVSRECRLLTSGVTVWTGALLDGKASNLGPSAVWVSMGTSAIETCSKVSGLFASTSPCLQVGPFSCTHLELSATVTGHVSNNERRIICALLGQFGPASHPSIP